LVPEVQIPENLLLLEKLGGKILRNPVVYDYYWRMLRNLKKRSVQQVKGFYPGAINPIIKQMITFQSRFSLSLLRNGIVSKSLMLVSYMQSVK
jgi:hypothetical protein